MSGLDGLGWPNPEDEPRTSRKRTALLQPRIVQLLQCGRKSCGHVLIKEECEWRGCQYESTATCPKCGNEDFWTLKENGQKVKASEMDAYRDGVDPETIEASPRMGLKMTKALIRAKWYVIHSQANAATHAPGANEKPLK